jgi:trigger factor
MAVQREELGDKFNEKDARKEAERRVKLGLILSEWGSAEKVEVSQSEIQQAIFQEAYRNGANPQQVMEHYQKNQNALAMMRGMLFEQKVLSAMIDRCAKKEKKVNAEELFKQK